MASSPWFEKAKWTLLAVWLICTTALFLFRFGEAFLGANGDAIKSITSRLF